MQSAADLKINFKFLLLTGLVQQQRLAHVRVIPERYHKCGAESVPASRRGPQAVWYQSHQPPDELHSDATFSRNDVSSLSIA